MPTHEDYPWERDARRFGTRSRRSGRRRTRLALLFVAIGAVVVAATQRRDDPRPTTTPARTTHGEPSPHRATREGVRSILKPPRERAPASRSPQPRLRLTGLRSRFLDQRTLEVWGRTNAPDGATIRLSIEAGGRRFKLGDAPAAHGRFYARESLPAAARGLSLRIGARIVG